MHAPDSASHVHETGSREVRCFIVWKRRDDGSAQDVNLNERPETVRHVQFSDVLENRRPSSQESLHNTAGHGDARTSQLPLDLLPSLPLQLNPSPMESGADSSEEALNRTLSDVSPEERWWVEHRSWLESEGYLLRPRFQPGWEPSWHDPKVDFFDAEDQYAVWVSDSLTCGEEMMTKSNQHPDVLDATRLSDGVSVVLKRVNELQHPTEVEITTLLSSPPLSSDPRNHCVPLFDVLKVPDHASMRIMVLPLLRRCADPRFDTVGEVVDCLQQILEVSSDASFVVHIAYDGSSVCSFYMRRRSRTGERGSDPAPHLLIAVKGLPPHEHHDERRPVIHRPFSPGQQEQAPRLEWLRAPFVHAHRAASSISHHRFRTVHQVRLCRSTTYGDTCTRRR